MCRNEDTDTFVWHEDRMHDVAHACAVNADIDMDENKMTVWVAGEGVEVIEMAY